MRNEIFIFTALALVTACSSTPVLKMEAYKAPIDDTVTAPTFKIGAFKKIMVIPPPGTPKGKFDSVINTFEREFLRSGIVVISGAITARVAGESLGDAEKALLLAKKSGADAILQIGEWGWSKEASARRFFLFDDSGRDKVYKEVNAPQYQAANGLKYAFPSSELRFVGRLIHAESGEVLASFEVKSSANYNLPSEYVAQVEVENDKPVLKQENFTYMNTAWYGDAVKATETSIVKSVCDRLIHGAPVPATIAVAVPTLMPGQVTEPKAEPKEEKRELTEAPVKETAEVAATPTDTKSTEESATPN